jgi:hypothetical protein
MRIRSLCAALVLCLPTIGMARDVYLLRFLAVQGRQALGHQAVWSSDVLLYNRTAADAVVRLLDVSNGAMPNTIERSLIVPPGRVISMGKLDPKFDWAPVSPFGSEKLWVMHVDMPEGITVESRNEVADDAFITPEHIGSRGPVGKVSMPVITQLVPAGTRQVTLGTDLISPGSRSNVMVYNAGDQAATATIEVRRACDDTALGKQIVSIPAHTIRQFASISNDLNTLCPAGSATEAYVRYTTVMVDQPSFTIVSTLTESQEPSIGDVTPIIELAVAVNTIF